MALKMSLFVDEVLDDTVRTWMRERDFEPARDRNECLPESLARLTACRRLANARPANSWSARLRVNALRGRCAEEQLIRRLCGRTIDVRNQIRIGPRRGGSVLDVSSFPGARRRLPAGLESKYIHVSDYRDAAGRIQPAAIIARVPVHVAQVRRHMAHSAASHVPGLPSRVRLFYQLGGLMTESEFRDLAQNIYRAVAAANAQSPGHPQVSATVVRAF